MTTTRTNKEKDHNKNDEDITESDSDDNVPISQTLSSKKTVTSHTTKTVTRIVIPETQLSDKSAVEVDCVPLGEKALGEKVAREFEGLGIFRGFVEGVETERGRHYYNIR